MCLHVSVNFNQIFVWQGQPDCWSVIRVPVSACWSAYRLVKVWLWFVSFFSVAFCLSVTPYLLTCLSVGQCPAVGVCICLLAYICLSVGLCISAYVCCLPFHPGRDMSVCASDSWHRYVCQYVCLSLAVWFVCLSAYGSVSWHICLSVGPCVCLLIYNYIYWPFSLPVSIVVCLSIGLFICWHIYVCLSACLSVCWHIYVFLSASSSVCWYNVCLLASSSVCWYNNNNNG